MSTVRVKRGDIGVVFSDVLEDDNGPIDLTDATVGFLMRRASTLRTRIGVIDDGPAGRVHYTSVSGDLDTVGTWAQEWEITFVNGDVFTCPSNRTNSIIVIRDLDYDEE